MYTPEMFFSSISGPPATISNQATKSRDAPDNQILVASDLQPIQQRLPIPIANALPPPASIQALQPTSVYPVQPKAH